MIAVTDLTGYMYCPRKLYFRKVLGFKEKPKPQTVKGKIKHAVFEHAGKEDREIATSFTPKDLLENLEMRYRKIYYKVLMYNIQRNRKEIISTGLDPMILYRELWPFFLEEAKDKSAYFYNFAKNNNVYGEELWLALPKGIPELRIRSEKLGLIGIVDKVEVDQEFIPVEIKTGKAPREGVWKENRVQIGAYMLLLSEHYGKDITEGYIDYKAINERRIVTMNPFLKDEIMELIQRVNILLAQSVIPDKIEDSKKCQVCGIREKCLSNKEQEKGL